MHGGRVAVVGAGWGGLTAAVELVGRNHPVTVFEAAPAPGGRARALEIDGQSLDNGQHLLLGAYRDTLRLMRTVGADPERLFERRPLALRLGGASERFELELPRGPASLALALGLLRSVGPSVGDRLRALAGAAGLRRPPQPDCDAATWLSRCGQPPSLQRGLWAPLCLAALNVPPERASARVLARVLAEAFRGGGASDLLLPRTDLGGLFPRPARDWLARHGAEVLCGRRVRALEAGAAGWRLDAGAASGTFDHVVLAGDARASAQLLPADLGCRPIAERLGALGSAPITTVYLRYPARVALAEPMVGRLDAPGQWIFDRRLTGQPGVMAVVVSGEGEHMAGSRERLAAEITAQLARAFPHWPPPEATTVVREKRATFDCRPGSDERRVGVHGPLPGLWFAGDHVASGLPATIEGAVRAGIECARALDTAVEEETRQ